MSNIVFVSRPALYQGSIPVTENGWQCKVCGASWWPHFVGSNDATHPYRHTDAHCEMVLKAREARR